MQLLTDRIKPSIINSLSFDESTREQIITFFRFIAGGKTGIPQADNDIISGFIGHLFLTIGDLYVDDEIKRDYSLLKKHSIFRYVDDIYISLTFNDEVPYKQRELLVSSLLARVVDTLYNNLGLRLNRKTAIFRLDDEGQRLKLIDSLAKISPEHYQSETEDDPGDKINSIFHTLEKMHGSNSGTYWGR